MAACQDIELRLPLKSNVLLEGYWSAVRSVAAYSDHDRYFQSDLEAIAGLIRANTFGDWLAAYIEDQ